MQQEKRAMAKSYKKPEQNRSVQLEEEIMRLAEGNAQFWKSEDCPPEVLESNLEDILNFESVGNGTSLFEGLRDNGIDLPHPDTLNEALSFRKVLEIFKALDELRIFLIGFENMSAKEVYSTLWNETLWEGNYVKKRHPAAFTIIDISHKMPRSEILATLEEIAKSCAVH
jgi:hypothetical protein